MKRGFVSDIQFEMAKQNRAARIANFRDKQKSYMTGTHSVSHVGSNSGMNEQNNDEQDG